MKRIRPSVPELKQNLKELGVEKHISTEDIKRTNDACIETICYFKNLAGPIYDKLGFPLTTTDDAARALLGQLLEGAIRVYGIDYARGIVERVLQVTEQSEFGEPCVIDTLTGEIRHERRS